MDPVKRFGVSAWGVPRSRLGLMIHTGTVVILLLLGGYAPALWTMPPPVLVAALVLLLGLLPRSIPVVEESWLLERTEPRAMAAAATAEGSIAVTATLVALAVESPRPLVAAAGSVLVLGFVVAALVPSVH